MDVRHPAHTTPQGHDNLLELVFNVENARTAEALQQMAARIVEVVSNHPNKARIDKVKVRWFKHFLHHNRINIDTRAVSQLQEVPKMLASRVETWFAEWKQQGLEEGRAEGRAAGRLEGRAEGREKGLVEGRMEGRLEGRLAGRAELLGKQLRIKFGNLPDSIAQRLEQASEQELELWSERILFENSLEAIFTEHQNQLE